MIRATSIDDHLRGQLALCWRDTANVGGAVGFPWPPVELREVQESVDDLAAQVEADRTLLVVATDRTRVLGWVSMDRNDSPLVAHWATERRLQTYPDARGQGIGRALMTELERVDRADGLRRLHLAVRSEMGLEDFYRKLGWQQVGAWPDALRMAEDDYRDEILMSLDLRNEPSSESTLEPE